MNIQGPLSPASIASSEWSGVGRYESLSPKPRLAPTNRGNLITPPPFGSTNGMNGISMNGMNSMGGRQGDFRGQPSPPASVGRSSNGTQLSIEAQRRKQSTLEENLGQHYLMLKRYLANTIREDQLNGKPNRARDKLVRLSPIQFQELSTDVYDELLRRQAAQNGVNAPEFLPPRDNFHPKRNQARQKLSTLPASRFRALATDVFFELERRFPRFAGGSIARDGSPSMSIGPPSRSGTPLGVRPGSRDQVRRPPPRQGSLGGQLLAGNGIPGMGDGPMQKSSQSNTVVPNKSYLVEDDDDGDMDSLYATNRRDTTRTDRSYGVNEKMMSDYQFKIEELTGRMNDLERTVREKEDTVDRLEREQQKSGREMDNAASSWQSLRADLEDKLADAQALNDKMQSEIANVRSQHDDQERIYREQLDMLANKSSDGGEWRGRYENAQQENQDLRQDTQDLQRQLKEQRGLTEEVRREAAGFLAEMRAISDRNDETFQREAQLAQRVQKLEEELKDWKGRYARAKTQLRSARTGSMGMSVPQPDLAKEGLVESNGMIQDIHVTKFQLGINELLCLIRTGETQELLNSIRALVATVKEICEDVPTDNANDAASQARQKMRSKISATANNLITAVKNFVASKGISPVSLVDAAASHLSTAVASLVHSVKMRPSSVDQMTDEEVEDDGMLDLDAYGVEADLVVPEKSPKYFSTNGRSSVSESVYSTTTATARASSKYAPFGGVAQFRDLSKERPLPAANGPTNGPTIGLPNGIAEYPTEPSFGVSEHDEAAEELKLFLQEQTATLIETIQSLVTSIRTSEPPTVVRARVSTTATLVGDIIQRASSVIDDSPHQAIRDAAGPVVRNLASCKAKLLAAEDSGMDAATEEEWKRAANAFPPIAFEIAREVRELGARVASVGVKEEGGSDEDDFR